MQSIHIGNIVKEELRKQERTISWFARKLYCDRSNVYDIFKRESVDTELLLRISLVLKRNFFLLYVDEFELRVRI
ncbi:MAG: XRE family transcriptional regulator [Bacteroidales bacterium]|nr:XRE family transcriptional regulator [Bacteroidales bacterium]